METAQLKKELLTLGFLTNLSGYRCLIYAIPMYYANPGQSITKQLYPEVGELFMPKLSGDQVEKQIRYAIAAAWRNRDEENWRRYFPMDKRPTNSEFISRLSETLAVRKL